MFHTTGWQSPEDSIGSRLLQLTMSKYCVSVETNNVIQFTIDEIAERGHLGAEYDRGLWYHT